MPPTRWVAAPDADLRCWTRGTGPPVLVVAGGPGFGSHYLDAPLTTLLADALTLIFYDQRGSGQSSGHAVASRLTMAQFVADLDAVRDASGHNRVTILGHSFGGLLGIHYALAYPEHVTALVIVDGDPITYADWSTFRGVIGTRQSKAAVQRLAEMTAPAGWDRRPEAVEEYFRVALLPYFGDTTKAVELTFGFTGRAFEQLQATSTAVRRDLGEWDLRGAVADLKVPTLLIYGAAGVFPIAAAERLRALLPDASLHVLPDVGHFPFLEAPDTFRALVREFLANPRLRRR
jgi:proline iminopeptidase